MITFETSKSIYQSIRNILNVQQSKCNEYLRNFKINLPVCEKYSQCTTGSEVHHDDEEKAEANEPTAGAIHTGIT